MARLWKRAAHRFSSALSRFFSANMEAHRPNALACRAKNILLAARFFILSYLLARLVLYVHI